MNIEFSKGVSHKKNLEKIQFENGPQMNNKIAIYFSSMNNALKLSKYIDLMITLH